MFLISMTNILLRYSAFAVNSVEMVIYSVFIHLHLPLLILTFYLAPKASFMVAMHSASLEGSSCL